MVSISTKSKQLIIAAGLALGIIALGACSGGGGGSITSPVSPPNVPVTPGGTWSGTLSSAGMSVNLPSVAGFNETLTFPANNATSGTTLTIKVSSGAPAGMPRLDPDMHVVLPYFYLQLSSSKSVTLNGFPGFKLQAPAHFNFGMLPAKIGYYDPKTGWTHVGDLTWSGGGLLTFTPTKTPVALLANTTYYALPYTCGGPSPSPTPTGVISCTASGTGAIGVLCINGTTPKTYGFVGKGRAGSSTVEQIDISTGASAGSSGAPFHTYSDTFGPTNCSGDEKHLRVFCTGFGSATITDINATTHSNTEFGSGATGGLSFSGGFCVICNLAFDPMDTAFIIEDAAPAGGGQYQRVGESSHAIDMSIGTSDPNENPGYDYVKNWVFDPGYSSSVLRIEDFTNGKGFSATSATTNMSTPDSGCVDVSTHVADTGNEFTPPDIVTLADLGSATEGAGGTLTVTTGQTTIAHSNDGSLDDDACATDSVLHLTFYQGEFDTPNLGFALLPTSSSGTTISDWAFAPWPLAPDGTFFGPGADPHTVASFNDPVNCPDCALSVNDGLTWLAVIDLFKFEHAPRKSGDPHTIDPTYDLVANHVIAFYKI